MMRMASRGNDGLAKPVKSDYSGSIITRDTVTIPLNGKTYIKAGETIDFGAYGINHEGYNFALLEFSAKYEAKVYISYWTIDATTGSWKQGDWEQIYITSSVRPEHNKIEIALKKSTFSIRFENYGSLNGQWTNQNRITLSHREMLVSDKISKIDEKSNNLKRQLFESSTLSAGSFKDGVVPRFNDGLSVREADGYPYAKIYIPERFPMDIYYRGYVTESNGVLTLQENTLIYSSKTSSNKIVELVVPMKYQTYQYRIHNRGTTSGFIPTQNYEVLYEYDPELPDKLENMNENLKGISRPTKMPSKLLEFKRLPISMVIATKGTDGNFYVVDGTGNVKKYTKVAENNEPSQTGINFYEATGLVKSSNTSLTTIVYIPNSITYFAMVDGKATIYNAPDINTTPTVVYQSTNTETYFNNNFGIDYYANGTSFTGRLKLIVAAEYGMGQTKRNLLVSKDGGVTFEVKKQTKNEDTSSNYNSHWHDVAIDVYHGKIWASEGDGVINADIHYSEDFGDTWTTLHSTEQPTAIIPFPDKVVFGRDSHLVGLDYCDNPKLISDGFKEPKPLQEFINAQASSYYANSPVVLGNEAYMTFTLYSSVESNAIIVGTGDFGKSWTGLAIADPNISNFWAIDENYVYAFDKYYGYGIYAEKPKWI